MLSGDDRIESVDLEIEQCKSPPMKQKVKSASGTCGTVTRCRTSVTIRVSNERREVRLKDCWKK